MARFDELAAFATVVRERSFTRAAAQMGVSQSALSQTVRALETRLELKLLNRTTRSVSPTEAGERLYQTVAPRFADIEAELAALGDLRGRASGTVRINATESAVQTLVWPRLQPWLTDHPDIKVEISSDNRFIDIVAERFDIGVRLGNDVAKDMIAVRMAPDLRMAVAASPEYLARRGKPHTPQDLTEHNCIALRLPTHGGLLAWEFKRRGKSINVHPSGQLVFNTTALAIQGALAGHGLVWASVNYLKNHLDSGELVTVLDGWAMVYPGHHLYYASRSASPALMLVVQALKTP
ncbi:LysR family transcriptional regulator [Xanthomonas arboricola]|uniref:LysR family transcriptional regulator n=1 Tax=Xanthomonas arboricola TaxID=56448 RepID=UPI0016227F47|nr:LysR family transcriptional regulator [Xanthomonas arboricola]MBB4596475.1 DNA-binding transcriptional LysR family regulator [Xanthomonas arboricola]